MPKLNNSTSTNLNKLFGLTTSKNLKLNFITMTNQLEPTTLMKNHHQLLNTSTTKNALIHLFNTNQFHLNGPNSMNNQLLISTNSMNKLKVMKLSENHLHMKNMFTSVNQNKTSLNMNQLFPIGLIYMKFLLLIFMNMMKPQTTSTLFKNLKSTNNTSTSMNNKTTTKNTNPKQFNGLTTSKNQKKSSTPMMFKLESSLKNKTHHHMFNNMFMTNTFNNMFNTKQPQFNGIITMKNQLNNSMDMMLPPNNTSLKKNHLHTENTSFLTNQLKTTLLMNQSQSSGVNTMNNLKNNSGNTLKKPTPTLFNNNQLHSPNTIFGKNNKEPLKNTNQSP